MQQQYLFEEEGDGDDMLSIFKAIHREPDAFVPFGRKDSSGYHDLFSFKVAEFEAMFPALVPYLVRESFFGVNSTFRASTRRNHITGFPDVLRGKTRLRYLNACYADLDVGRVEGDPDVDPDTDPAKLVTWRDAAAHLGNMMDAGEIPQASIFARSGRGLYVIWLLDDDKDKSKSVRAWPEAIAAYENLQRHIQRRLEHLASDVKAVDAARVLRVPGTLHRINQAPAVYQIQKDARGRTFSYTMRELAAFFRVRGVDVGLPRAARRLLYGPEDLEELEGQPVIYGRPVVAPGSVPNRLRGAQEVNLLRAHDVLSLSKWCNGWPRGRRRFHLKLYGSFLRGAGIDREQVLEAVRDMASFCRPPYPSDPNDTPLSILVSEVFREPFRIDTNVSLCKRMGITAEVARKLCLLTIVPPEVTAERKLPPGGQREVERQARRAFIRAYVAKNGCPAADKMAQKLAEAGHDASRRTVSDDMNALGYATEPARRAGRKPKAQRLQEQAAQRVLEPAD